MSVDPFDIAKAAIARAAEEHKAVDLDRFVDKFDLTAATKLEGAALELYIEKRIVAIRKEFPQLFQGFDWSKASAADRRAKEAELRGFDDRAPASVPAWLKTLDTSKLNRSELAACGNLLTQPTDRYALGIMERAATRLGIDTAQ